MPKVQMERDGSKPEAKLPVAFRPGGGVMEGFVEMLRDNVRWQVLGYDEEGRLWAKGSQGSAWLAPGRTRSRTTSP